MPPDTEEDGKSREVFTNVGDYGSAGASLTVILLDAVNTHWTDQSRARQSVLRFLGQVRPDDRIAIYVLSFTGIRVMHEFTRDASDLVAQLRSWKGVLPAKPTPNTDRQLWSFLAGSDRDTLLDQKRSPQAQAAPVGSAEYTLKLFEAVADHLSAYPGRKNVLWISDGFPLLQLGNIAGTLFAKHGGEPALVRSIDPADNSDTVFDTIGNGASSHVEQDRAMHSLDRANVAVYPIEARGLQTCLETGPGTNAAVLYAHGTQQAMEEIAQRTGGRAFVRGNDILGAIRRVIDESKVTYTLGFYPEETRMDGQFHRVTIKLLNRRPGIRLTYRRGYVDSLQPARDLALRDSDFTAAASSPLDANAVPLTAHLERGLIAGNFGLDLKIYLSGLNLRQEDDHWVDQVDLYLVQQDPHGTALIHDSKTLALRLRQSTFLNMLQTGLLYNTGIHREASAQVLKVVVRDANFGNIGSLTIPLN